MPLDHRDATHDKLARRQRTNPHREIEPRRDDVGFARAGEQLEPQPRALRKQRAKSLPIENANEIWREAHPDDLGSLGALAARHDSKLVTLSQQRACMVCHLFGNRCGANHPRRAHEQLHLELSFEPRNPLRDGVRREALAPRCSGDAAQFEDQQEGL